VLPNLVWISSVKVISIAGCCQCEAICGNMLCNQVGARWALVIGWLWFLAFKATEGVQCFNCRGITNYDPNHCFEPSEGKTILQECKAGEMCEKRVTMVDRLQDVIDRGCSTNCNGRKFVWTDQFQVYCCNDQDFCNTATTSSPHSITLLLATVTCSVVVSFLRSV
jgi:hypothetical protein